MNSDFRFDDIFKIIRKNFKIFMGVSIISVALAVIFSSPTFIPPKYKSEAVVYPINISNYGTESRIEQMLQLFEGNDIRDSIIPAATPDQF